MTPRGFIDAASTAFSGAGAVHQQPQQRDDEAAHDGGKDLVLGCADAEDLDDAIDDRQHGLGVVGEEISDHLLDHDPPQQRAGEDEDLLLFIRYAPGVLDRLHHCEIGGKGCQEGNADADQCASIGADIEDAGGGPGRHRCRHHDGTVGEVEHTRDTEDQCEAGGTESVESADGKAINQNLESSHL
ncbi:hypothetical protein ACVWW2_006603 [Bradyrhizobium sp. LM4.3]